MKGGNRAFGSPEQGELSRECVTEGLWSSFCTGPSNNPSVIRLA